MKFLIIDDDPISRRILENYLKILNNEVISAVNGVEGFNTLRSQKGFDIIITDWIMPEMDGIELCRKIRSSKYEKYLPIILLTSKGDKQDLIAALNAGADAFLTKPVNLQELQAQIHVCERILTLEEELADKLKELQKAHDRLRNDLKAAAKIQSAMLPKEPPNFPRLECDWYFQACETIAGDMFNVFKLDENHLAVYVLDVSGHGIPAALLSVSLSRALTPFPEQGGILLKFDEASKNYQISSPKEVVEELNRRFPIMAQTGHFFTILYGIFEFPECVFRFVRAGQIGPIVISEEKVNIYNEGGSVPIGIVENAECEEVLLKLNCGDKVLFITDGVSETINKDEEEFEIERILKLFSENKTTGIKDSITLLCESIEKFSEGLPQRDDITILGIEVRK